MESPPVLDCRGLFCPIPIIELQKAIRKIEVGETLVLLADDPGIEKDLPQWCVARRHDLLSLETADGDPGNRTYRGTVRRAH